MIAVTLLAAMSLEQHGHSVIALCTGYSHDLVPELLL